MPSEALLLTGPWTRFKGINGEVLCVSERFRHQPLQICRTVGHRFVPERVLWKVPIWHCPFWRSRGVDCPCVLMWIRAKLCRISGGARLILSTRGDGSFREERLNPVSVQQGN